MIRRVSVVLFGVLALGTYLLTPAQNAPTNAEQPIRKPSNHSGLPVRGEFENSEPASAQEQQARQIRENRYGNQLPEPLFDPGLTVDGQPETSHLRFIDYVLPENAVDPPGIPASISTAIVVGTITSGKCFVNKTHRYVYTDYQVKVDSILKQNSLTPIAVGDSLTAARPGGAVHFPSDHVMNVLYVGHGLPEIGSQYILFLWKAIPDLPEYEILIDSGYQLKDDRAYALDNATSQYDREEVNTLLGKIEKAIAASQVAVKP
jgi:hypothetical protein